MIKRISYLIIGICILMFSGNADTSDFSKASEQILSEICSTDTISAYDSELLLPRPTGFANTLRVQSVTKRINSTIREAFCIVKKGKIINRNSQSSVSININLFPSGIYGHSHHLISLRKLVI